MVRVVKVIRVVSLGHKSQENVTDISLLCIALLVN